MLPTNKKNIRNTTRYGVMENPAQFGLDWYAGEKPFSANVGKCFAVDIALQSWCDQIPDSRGPHVALLYK